MASITKKTIRGHQYYYARECQRINGKPKIVWQKYLGRADDIIHALSQAQTPVPEQVDVVEFGLSSALYDIAQSLDIVGIIDRHCPKRDQGISIGQYMLLAAINRCSKPTSKNKIGEWYESSSLRRLMPLPSSLLTSRRFWDNMSLMSTESIRAIEKELTSVLVEKEGVELSCLLYDTTNFFTYIDTDCKSSIPQRGHNKQKRDDLKQIGLALLVSRDHHIPLFHEAYAGNTHDCSEFASVIEKLVERYETLCKDCRDITLVFDKGNNSQGNIDSCGSYHYVGSLVASQHSDLLAIPLEQYTPLASGQKAYKTSKEVFGKKHVICLTFNEEFYEAQMQGFVLQISKRVEKLQTLKKRLESYRHNLATPGPKPRASAVEQRAAKIVKGQHMKEVINYKVTETDGLVSLDFAVDEQAVSRVAGTLFGKSVIFTDREDMNTETIVETYHSQYQIEDAFKQMKDPQHVCFWPVYHWTDQKIRVHVFYCVLALTLSSLLMRRLAGAGLYMGPKDVYEQLSEIQEVMLLYPGNKGKPKAVTTTNQMRDVQRKLFGVLNLGRLLPC